MANPWIMYLGFGKCSGSRSCLRGHSRLPTFPALCSILSKYYSPQSRGTFTSWPLTTQRCPTLLSLKSVLLTNRTRGAERQVCLVCRCSHMLRSFVYNMISKKRLPQSTYPNLVQFDSLMSIWSLKYKWWVILLILQKEDLRNTLVCGAAGTSYLTLFEPQ